MDRIRRVFAHRGRTLLVLVVLLGFGAAAGAVGFALQPPVAGDVGPGTVAVDPSLRAGDTVVDLPPLGQIRADSHRGPLGFDVRLNRIDLDRAGDVALGADPAARLRTQVEGDLRPLLWDLVSQTALVAVLAGVAAGLVLPRRRLRYIGATLAGSVGFVAVAGAVTVSSFRPERFDQPKFEGALAVAPDILNTVQRHIDDVSVVESRLEALSDRVAGLYRSIDGSGGTSTADTTILHVSDLHSNLIGIELVEEAATRFGVDAIIDTGDLTSFGASIEGVVADRISQLETPYYVVPGNHDSPTIRRTLSDAGVSVLDPGVVEIRGIRILGVADPTFTADNAMSDEQVSREIGEAARDTARLARQHRPDVVAVHNASQLEEALGSFAVGLAGHVHEPGLEYVDGTALVEAGSGGATGVGALLTEVDLPYQMQLLQFDDEQLVAIDRVAFAGTDGAFRLERILIDRGQVEDYPDEEEPAPLIDQFTGREPPP